ncbi:hypothetical protein BH09SUM1_BH09SUM1_23330 [soil metagenome]
MHSPRISLSKAYFAILAVAIVLILPIASQATGYNTVPGYFRKNGTYVQTYRRTNPNYTISDNYGYPGNFNPNANRFTSYPRSRYGSGIVIRHDVPLPSSVYAVPSRYAYSQPIRGYSGYDAPYGAYDRYGNSYSDYALGSTLGALIIAANPPTVQPTRPLAGGNAPIFRPTPPSWMPNNGPIVRAPSHTPRTNITVGNQNKKIRIDVADSKATPTSVPPNVNRAPIANYGAAHQQARKKSNRMVDAEVPETEAVTPVDLKADQGSTPEPDGSQTPNSSTLDQ